MPQGSPRLGKIEMFGQANYRSSMIVQVEKRPTTSLRLLCEAAGALGISASACLEATSIRAEDLVNPDVSVTTMQEVQAIENFVRLAPSNVGLGVLVGRNMHVNAFGIWGFAILTSPTLRSAIQTSVDYITLSFVIADMSLKEADGRGRLEFGMEGLPPTTHRFLLERHAQVAMNFIRELIQEPSYQGFRIETIDEDPDYESELASLLGTDVVGRMPAHALTFPADLLDQPLPKSDPISLRFCIDQCKALVERNEGALPPWSQKVREAVIDGIGSEQRIDDVAERLSVTERTLRRRLAEEGTSFRDLYTDARMAIAYELLKVAGLNVETVAWRVGYAEPASFVRAFSKKFEKTPGDVRKSS